MIILCDCYFVCPSSRVINKKDGPKMLSLEYDILDNSSTAKFPTSTLRNLRTKSEGLKDHITASEQLRSRESGVFFILLYNPKYNKTIACPFHMFQNIRRK